ncbi:MAG: GntR family transcriptional regulator [Candidatus Atribacteria bacterium]|nr:GntR family transcriptional regulator [Candidatus Atribacteria bacterium]
MKKIRSDNLVDLVYQRIKEMILNGIIVSGDKINKIELSEQLGVSITPINEVINRLTGEKFIEKRGRKGYFVKESTLKDLTEFFTVRAGLEGMAIRLCIEDLPESELVEFEHFFMGYKLPLSQREMKNYIKEDQMFHEKIIKLCGNSIIIDFDQNFCFVMKSYQKGLVRPPEETLPEHQEIIKAIREKKSQKAQDLLIDHLLKSMHTLKSQYAGK